MSADEIPRGIPERRAEPFEGDTLAPTHRPALLCPCGKPAWVFPAPGRRFCGFCQVSQDARRTP